MKCFIDTKSTCLELCYNSYITALNTTANTLKESGYLRMSRYITLVYGEKYDEWDRISKFNDLPADIHGMPVPYLERNVFDSSKDI